MSRWKVKTSTLFLLSFLVAIMLLIVVLPDVDLDDIAFHGGTAPLLVHARGTTPPSAIVLAAEFRTPRQPDLAGAVYDSQELSANLDPNFRPILLRSIRR